MDKEATVLRQQMDKTLTGLTDKLGALGDQVSGTVRTVQESVNTVRETFDLKLHVRRRPWTLVAGAAALGFLCGSRSNARRARHPVQNGRNPNAALAREAGAEAPCTETNDGTNGANAARLSAAAAPGWLASMGNTFQPEIGMLRGVAAGTVLEVVREVITRQVPRPMDQPVDKANNGSNGKRLNQKDTSL